MRRPSLPQVAIPVPCRVDWNGMMRITRDGLVRFCDSCERPVYDSTGMTRATLRDLIIKNEGERPCVRLHVRPDGTLVTRDCFAPILAVGRALWLKASLLAVAFWAWAFGLRPLAQNAGRISEERQRRLVAESEPRQRMGEIRVIKREAPSLAVRRETPEQERLRLLLAPPRGPGEGPTPSGLGLFEWIDRAPPLRFLDTDRD
jgi:hypothetical protein